MPDVLREGSCAQFSLKDVARAGVLSSCWVRVEAMTEDDHESLTLRRALRAPEFWLLLVASVAATAGVAW